VLEVDNALRLAGRAGAVQPERHVVSVRRRRGQLVVLRGKRAVELDGVTGATRDELQIVPGQGLAQ
jgi:hypothetical protein